MSKAEVLLFIFVPGYTVFTYFGKKNCLFSDCIKMPNAEFQFQIYVKVRVFLPAFHQQLHISVINIFLIKFSKLLPFSWNSKSQFLIQIEPVEHQTSLFELECSNSYQLWENAKPLTVSRTTSWNPLWVNTCRKLHETAGMKAIYPLKIYWIYLQSNYV